jgi:cyclase
LGRPEVLVENLDRWGADEILIQCIDRSVLNLGPDFVLLGKLAKLGISTPLIYGGGISNPDHAVRVVASGADRILIDALLKDSPQYAELIARDLGVQAIVANLTVRRTENGFETLDYRNRQETSLVELLKTLPIDWVSEVMLTDWLHEGLAGRFDESLLQITGFVDRPLICFGGISEVSQIKRALDHPNIVAIGIGNFLSYRELAVQFLKEELDSGLVRGPVFERGYSWR